MSPTVSNNNQINKSGEVFSTEALDKPCSLKVMSDPITLGLNKPQAASFSKGSDYSIYKSLNLKIELLNNKIKCLSDKLIYKKCQEITKSMDLIKNSSESQLYLNSIKKYIIEDEDTESSSDDCYSQIDYNYGSVVESSPRMVNKYQSWLVERCQFQAKWSWLLSEIQSTEFRLKHLKKYIEEIKHLKRKYNSKNELNNEENSRNRHLRLEKRKRSQIHNLLSNDLIKFVSPLYSNDDNSSDRFVQCKCRLGDTGPCILCCGMKNKISDPSDDFHDKEDLRKSSILDNCIHTKLSSINDVRNQMKRNVLFNGYVKNVVPHWSYPRVRSSLSPILSAPPQPRIDNIDKVESVYLEFVGVNLDKKDCKPEFSSEGSTKIENETVIDRSSDVKVDIKLPAWHKIEDAITGGSISQGIVIEDMGDEVYIKRHGIEENSEREQNYNPVKGTSIPTDSVGRPNFHGYEYKQNPEQSYDLRLFPMSPEEFKQMFQLDKTYLHRSKRFKKKVAKF